MYFLFKALLSFNIDFNKKMIEAKDGMFQSFPDKINRERQQNI